MADDPTFRNLETVMVRPDTPHVMVRRFWSAVLALMGAAFLWVVWQGHLDVARERRWRKVYCQSLRGQAGYQECLADDDPAPPDDWGPWTNAD